LFASNPTPRRLLDRPAIRDLLCRFFKLSADSIGANNITALPPRYHLVDSEGERWRYQSSKALEQQLASKLKDYWGQWHIHRADKLSTPLFRVFAGPGIGKSRLLWQLKRLATSSVANASTTTTAASGAAVASAASAATASGGAANANRTDEKGAPSKQPRTAAAGADSGSGDTASKASKASELQAVLKEAYHFTITFHNGTRFSSREVGGLWTGDHVLGTRLLWQLVHRLKYDSPDTGAGSVCRFPSFERFAEEVGCRAADVLDAVDSLFPRPDGVRGFFVCVDELSALAGDESTLKSLTRALCDLALRSKEQFVVVAIAGLLSLEEIAAQNGLSGLYDWDSTQLRVDLTPPAFSALQLFETTHPVGKQLLEDVGSFPRAMQDAVKVLQNNKIVLRQLSPLQIDDSDDDADIIDDHELTYSRPSEIGVSVDGFVPWEAIALNIEHCFSSRYGWSAVDQDTRRAALRLVLSGVPVERSTLLPGTKLTVAAACVYGLIRVTEQRLEMPFILVRHWARYDSLLSILMMNTYNETEASLNKALPPRARTWANLEHVVAAITQLRRKLFSGAEFPLTKYMPGVRWLNADVANTTIVQFDEPRAELYDVSGHQFNTAVAADTKAILTAESATVSVEHNVFVNATSAPSADVFAALRIRKHGGQWQTQFETHQCKLVIDALDSKALHKEWRKACVCAGADAGDNEVHDHIFIAFCTAEVGPDVFVQMKAEAKAANKLVGVVDRTNWHTFFGPLSARAFVGAKPNANYSSFSRLREIQGIGPVGAKQILSHKPFEETDVDALSKQLRDIGIHKNPSNALAASTLSSSVASTSYAKK
jgi:hypothetical protein